MPRRRVGGCDSFTTQLNYYIDRFVSFAKIPHDGKIELDVHTNVEICIISILGASVKRR